MVIPLSLRWDVHSVALIQSTKTATDVDVIAGEVLRVRGASLDSCAATVVLEIAGWMSFACVQAPCVFACSGNRIVHESDPRSRCGRIRINGNAELRIACRRTVEVLVTSEAGDRLAR